MCTQRHCLASGVRVGKMTMTFVGYLLCDYILLYGSAYHFHGFLRTFKNWGTGTLAHFTNVTIVKQELKPRSL